MKTALNDINIRREGCAGRITLTRPKYLNALSASMTKMVEEALDHWHNDSDIEVVIIDAQGEKAFCAGGDISKIYTHGKSGDYQYGRDYWYQEYRMNLKLSNFPKPIISFMHGYILGGGVGLACHTSNRIVCESSKVAMPECGIGFIPDVGGTHLLSNISDSLSIYLALTGDRMSAADAINAGFADYFVPIEKWPELINRLVNGEGTKSIDTVVEDAPAGKVLKTFHEIAKSFEKNGLQDIIDELHNDASDVATKALNTISKSSPLSLCASIKAIRAARGKSLEFALTNEYRFAYRAQEHSDILEGIRAQIIDKDYTPKWRHDNYLAAEEVVDSMFNNLGDNEWKPIK